MWLSSYLQAVLGSQGIAVNVHPPSFSLRWIENRPSKTYYNNTMSHSTKSNCNNETGAKDAKTHESIVEEVCLQDIFF